MTASQIEAAMRQLGFDAEADYFASEAEWLEGDDLEALCGTYRAQLKVWS